MDKENLNSFKKLLLDFKYLEDLDYHWFKLDNSMSIVLHDIELNDKDNSIENFIFTFNYCSNLYKVVLPKAIFNGDNERPRISSVESVRINVDEVFPVNDVIVSDYWEHLTLLSNRIEEIFEIS